MKNDSSRILCTLLLIFYSFPAILFAQYRNIKIGEVGEFCEATITINPKYLNRMVACGVSDRMYYSFDFGTTWKEKDVKSKYGSFGDPYLIADNEGRFYLFHLSDPDKTGWDSPRVLDRVVCQTTNNGKKWKRGGTIGYIPPTQQDKACAIFDEYSSNIYVTYTQFDDYGSENPNDSSRIMFSYSDDRGKSWKPPIRINKVAGNCHDSNLTVKGANPAVGPKGEVYVTWVLEDKIFFDKSIDGGLIWLKNDKKIAALEGGWDLNVPGAAMCHSFPIIACDMSYGDYHGTIYVNWSDQRNGEENTDVWIIKSTDGGETWSKPLKVNDDNSISHQYLNWMTIDQVTGNIYIVFYDRREHKDNTTDVYLAYSSDGGNNFTNVKINESSFVPRADSFFGDYINISANSGYVRPVWISIDENNEHNLWTAIIDMF